MSLTLTQIAARVFRNAQIPSGNGAGSQQALVDAKQYINERARDVWKRRLWREYLILGTFTVPAGEQIIKLSDIVVDPRFNTSANGYLAAFYEIAGVRLGENPLMAEDPGAINLLRADLWEQTTTPVSFVNRGRNGIYLLGVFQSDSMLSFFGKAAFQDLTDSETWCIDNENCLIAGATGDIIRDNDRDDKRCSIRYQEYEAEIAKLIDAAEMQGANVKRIIPVNPWTNSLDPNLVDNSKTGYQPFNVT